MFNEISNIPAIVATAFVLGCLAYDLQRNLYRIMTGRTVVLFAVVIWYLLEALVVPVQLAEIMNQNDYDLGLACVGLSVVAFLLTYHFVNVPIFDRFGRLLVYLERPELIWLLFVGCLCIGFGGLILYLDFNLEVFLEGLTRMTARWDGLAVRARYGGWKTILYELQMFLQAAVPLAIALMFMKNAKSFQRIGGGLFVAWISIRTFTSGSRTPLIPIFLCLGAAMTWTAPPRARRLLILVGFPTACLVGIILSAVIVAGRNEGKLSLAAAEKTDYIGFEMFRELLVIARGMGEGTLAPQYGYTYFTQIVNPIPRAIWPDKPTADAGLILARAYGAVDKEGEAVMTISPGFLGEAYMNFSLVGVILIPAIAGVLVRAWDRLWPVAVSSLPAFLIYAAGLATIFASGRSFNFSTFYGLLSFALLLLLFKNLRLLGSAKKSRVPLDSRIGSAG